MDASLLSPPQHFQCPFRFRTFRSTFNRELPYTIRSHISPLEGLTCFDTLYHYIKTLFDESSDRKLIKTEILNYIRCLPP
jgi:hypothetical protein